MVFKTIKQAEDYFMGHYAQTNNMHGEEDARLDRWVEEQEIEELKEPFDWNKVDLNYYNEQHSD